MFLILFLQIRNSSPQCFSTEAINNIFHNHFTKNFACYHISPISIWRKRKLGGRGNEKPAQRQSCMGWYRTCKIVNSLSKIHVDWFKEIHFKLTLLTFLVLLLFLRKIWTAATFCYLIYFQSSRKFFCRGKISWCHEESVSLSLMTGLICFNIW